MDGAVPERGSLEMDAAGMDVMGEDAAQHVIGHLADIGRAAAEAADAGDRIARRPARGLNARGHGGVEGGALLRIDQLHRAGRQALGRQKGGVAGGEDVDDGVADGADVIGWVLGHGRPLSDSRPRVIRKA